jgi:hypothetical protein
MANFTELHLNNNRPQDPNKTSTKQERKSLSKEKTLFGAGLLAVTALSGVFLLITNGCSKGSSKSAANIEQPSSTNQPSLSPVSAPVVASTPAPVVAPKPAKKRVQHKAPMATYTEPAYGVSFKYPKSYVLKTGSETQAEITGLDPSKTDFVLAGGTTVAAIEVPRSSYPGTVFTSAFFGLNVNSGMSRQQCEMFASPKSDNSEQDSQSVSKVKIAGNEYAMVEDLGRNDKQESHLKYFHRYENGNCYEFSMGLGTVDDSIAGLKPVNRSLVFGRMEQILASVKIRPVVVPEVAKDSATHPIVEGVKE